MRQDGLDSQNDIAPDVDNGFSGAVDTLSKLTHQLISLRQPAVYDRLTVRGKGNDDAREILEMIQPDQLLSVPVIRVDAAQAMLAALWLWHDWLDQSHKISQDLHSLDGSFWHAILHRREGDFSNSKYWYAKAEGHPILPAIGANVAAAINHLPADKSLLRLLRDGWDPDALVDLVAEVSRAPADPRVSTVRAVQRLEWRMLFDHCARRASIK